MRINIYLSESNEKDKEIIDFLKYKYNSQAYIKELLYAATKGNTLRLPGLRPKAIINDIKEEFEEIKGLDLIEI